MITGTCTALPAHAHQKIHKVDFEKEMKELVLVGISIIFAYCTSLDDGETRLDLWMSWFRCTRVVQTLQYLLWDRGCRWWVIFHPVCRASCPPGTTLLHSVQPSRSASEQQTRDCFGWVRTQNDASHAVPLEGLVAVFTSSAAREYTQMCSVLQEFCMGGFLVALTSFLTTYATSKKQALQHGYHIDASLGPSRKYQLLPVEVRCDRPK